MKKIYLGFLAMLLGLSISAQAPVTSICVVTVDTTSSFNIITWERADQISTAGIDSMYIYRKDGAGVYNFIDAVDYDDLSEYQDTAAIADPNVTSSSYKIAGKDVNGLLGAMSAPAATIFLEYIYSGGVFTLSWNAYNSAPFTDYICWDKTPGQDVNLIQGNNTTWDFSNIVSGQSYEFMIDLTGMAGCTTSKANHNTSRSNKTAGGISLPTSVDEISITGFNLSPNPTDNELNVNFSSKNLSNSQIIIYNLLGEIVLQVPEATYLGTQKLNLDVSILNSGLYLVTLQNGSHTQTLRFSKK